MSSAEREPKPKPLYADEDVVRWEAVDRQWIPFHIEKLRTAATPRLLEHHFGSLASEFASQGMTHIARQEFGNAIDAFRQSVLASCKLHEPPILRNMDAGEFQTLLLAFVTLDADLIDRFAAMYRADVGTKGSIYLGRSILALANNDLEGASIALTAKQPKLERQFMGYPSCLDAIIRKNLDLLITALHEASRHWESWIRRGMRGLPDAVCFIQGIGLVRLAERIMGCRVRIDNRYLPAELLDVPH